MAIQSYDRSYLPYVAENLGTMLERIDSNGMDPSAFWRMFVDSALAKRIEKGHPKYLTCSSLDYLGELVPDKRTLSKGTAKKGVWYWSGWALAQLQYEKGLSFHRINECLPIEEVRKLYPTMHEADITRFYRVAEMYFKRKRTTNLKRIREAMGLSQSELSKRADVSLRSIQMYEQNKNDINKAQAITLHRLTLVLGCNIEDLLEN